MSFPDPRVLGGLGRPAARALDSAGVQTVSGPEPLGALAMRVVPLVAIILELLALRVFLSPHWSYRFLDGVLVTIGIRCAFLVLSGVPGFRWLENNRARPSFERTVRVWIFIAAVQVFVISSFILGDIPGDGWMLGGLVVYVIFTAMLPPWIADRWAPAARRPYGMHGTS